MAQRRVAGIKIDIQANVARLSQDMTKAVSILGGFERQANALGRGLKIALGGAILTGAALGVKALAKELAELAQLGDAASGIENAFTRLGGTSKALEEATTRTQGLIEKFDLMKIANDGLIKGIPNLNENLASLAELAAKVADARDENATEVFQRLIDAVSSGKQKSLKEFGFVLGDVKTQAEGTAVALQQLPQVLQQLGPIALGAGDSYAVFKNELATAQKEFAIGIDNSEGLTEAYQTLGEAIRDVNWRQVGNDIGIIVGELARLLLVIKDLLPPLETVTGALSLIGPGTRLAINDLQLLSNQVGWAYNKPRAALANTLLGPFLMGREKAANYRQQDEAYSKRIGDLSNKSEGMIFQMILDLIKPSSSFKKPPAASVAPPANAPDYTRPTGVGDSGIQKAAENAARELAKIQSDSLKQGIETAIETVNPTAFSNMRGQVYESTKAAYLEAHKDLVEQQKISEAELLTMAEANATETVKTYDERMTDALGRHAEIMQRSHEQAVQQWSGVLDQLFNPQEYSWEDSLKQLAKGFASEILAGLVGGINGDLTTFQGVGQVIGRAILGTLGGAGGQGSGAGWGNSYPDLSGATKGANQNLFDQFGSWISRQFSSEQSTSAVGEMFDPGSSNISTDAAHQAGIQGPGGADGQFNSGAGAESYAGYFQAGLQVFSDALAARDRDKANQDNSGTGAAVGGGIGGILGGIFGGPQGAAIGASAGSAIGGFIGSMFKWGAQNPETNARKAFSDYVEEGFKKLRTIGFFDAAGQMRLFNSQNLDFVTGASTRFNAGGDTGGTNWADNFNAMGAEVTTVFKGLGEAFEEVLGLTEDVGAQIGYILAINLGGNIDNARLLVQQLGLDMEDMIDALIEAGRTGEMTWLEVESAIQGVNSAFEEGLVAVGNVSGAWEEFVGSGGRGIAALKGLKDIAIEAMEAGARSLEDLRARLIQAGANPEAVDAMINAIRGRGISTLQELADANDRILGGIVADTNAASQSLTQQWEDMGNKVEEFKNTLTELDKQMTKDLTINVKTNFDSNTERAMDEGLYRDTPAEKLNSAPMNTPSSSSAKYRRTVSNNSGAKASSMTVNIDARGAQRGVHSDVTTAMAVMENRIVNRTANILYEQMQRGGL